MNPQALLYLIGVINEFGVRNNMVVGILQPRLRHFDIFTVSTKEVANFEKRAKEAAEKNLARRFPRTAGEHCTKFCAAAGNCGAFANWSLEAAGWEFVE